jgi:hypothetical protein
MFAGESIRKRPPDVKKEIVLDSSAQAKAFVS